jgi:SAM-dependent methyltransferase
LWNDPEARRLCAGCGVVWNPGVKLAVALEYTPEYFERYYSSRGPALIASFGAYLDQLKPFLGSGRWLDLGCGGGFFAAAALARGWSVTGMDPSSSALRLACSVAPAGRFLPDTVLALPVDELFEAISFWDSIAYVPDLPAVLDGCLRHLVPGGRLLIKTPHLPPRFHKASHYGLWWRPGLRNDLVQAQSTFWYFTPESLGRVLAAHGLEVVHRRWTIEVPIPRPRSSWKEAAREALARLVRATIGPHKSFILIARKPAAR